jgi:hypothetical protein
MSLLKNIDYSKMLYSTMGRYFSINAMGLLSVLYKYCLCIVYPLQLSFNAFDTWRRYYQLLAYNNWKMGQLQNTLNYLYDSSLNRIVINQQLNITSVYVRNSNELPSYIPKVFARNSNELPTSVNKVFIRNRNAAIVNAFVTINVPFDNTNPYWQDIINTCNIIKLAGINYTLKTI